MVPSGTGASPTGGTNDGSRGGYISPFLPPFLLITSVSFYLLSSTTQSLCPCVLPQSKWYLSLDSSKVYGADGIPLLALKECDPERAPVLARLYHFILKSKPFFFLMLRNGVGDNDDGSGTSCVTKR